MSKNLALWDRVRTPDPKHTKSFNRGGGFKGTSTNATYLARQATEQFGLCGIGWGMIVDDDQYIPGHYINDRDRAIIHRVKVRLWYVVGEQRGEIVQYGQTEFVGSNKYGPFTDEEAPKKSLTDAMSKCLSLLGFSADIHLGLYDDNKYVAEVNKMYAEAEAPPPPPPPPPEPEKKPHPMERKLKALFATLREKDLDPAAFRVGMEARFGYASTREITPGDYGKIMSALDAITDEGADILADQAKQQEQPA